MGLYNFFRTALTGVDVDEEQAKADAAGLQLSELNRRYADADERNARLAADDSHNFAGQVDQAFTDELGERADALRRGGDSLIGGTLRTLLRAVPVWVWIGLVLAALAYFWPTLRRLLPAKS